MDNKVYLQEAFKALDMLNEEDFNLDTVSGQEDFQDFIDTDEKSDFVDIIDPETTEEDELKDDYVGKIVLDCCVCHNKLYKDKDEIVFEDDEDVVNQNEECPICYSTDGFKIVGMIAPFEETEEEEVEVQEEPEEEPAEEIEVEDEDKINESFNVGDKFELNFNDGGDNAFLEILKVFKNGKVKYLLDNPNYPQRKKLRVDNVKDLEHFIKYNNFEKKDETEVAEEIEEGCSPRKRSRNKKLREDAESNESKDKIALFVGEKISDLETVNYSGDSKLSDRFFDSDNYYRGSYSALGVVYFNKPVSDNPYWLSPLTNSNKSVIDSIEISAFNPRYYLADDERTIAQSFEKFKQKVAKRYGVLPEQIKYIGDDEFISGTYGDLYWGPEEESDFDESFKRSVKEELSARRLKSPKRYVYEICDKLGWRPPMFIDAVAGGYRLRYREDSKEEAQATLDDIQRVAAEMGIEVKRPTVKLTGQLSANDDWKEYEGPKKKSASGRDIPDWDSEEFQTWKWANYHPTYYSYIVIPAYEEKVESFTYDDEDDFDESLKEDKVIYSLRELRDWIKDHKQATKDIERYYGKPVDNLFKDEIFDWLFDHEEMFNDFKKYFGVDESLKESADISEYQKWVDFDMKKYGRISGVTMRKIKAAGFSVVKDQYGDYEVIADRKDECMMTSEGCHSRPRRGFRKVEEDFERVEIETDREKMEMTADEEGKVTVITEPKEETVVPVDDTIQSEINPVEASEEEVAVKDELDIEEPEEDIDIDSDIDDFSEDEFDELGESYLKKIYENVDSYKTISVNNRDNKLIVEGIIKFNSGNKKKTSFIFESSGVNKNGKMRLIGENAQITRGKKAFTITGNVNNGRFITETLNYNYRAKDASGKSTRVYGTLRTSK